MDEYGFDPTTARQVAPEHVVTAVFSHPLHGRLIERVILWVRPNINFGKARYKLTWWGNGVAYYDREPGLMGKSPAIGGSRYMARQ
jgi:hypothetical protein